MVYFVLGNGMGVAVLVGVIVGIGVIVAVGVGLLSTRIMVVTVPVIVT